jgi:hypothetical protein
MRYLATQRLQALQCFDRIGRRILQVKQKEGNSSPCSNAFMYNFHSFPGSKNPGSVVKHL